MADQQFTGYIYVVTNTVNGKQYVGQTTASVDRRWREHQSASRGIKKSCRALCMAIVRHGAGAFGIQSQACQSQDEADSLERELIVLLGSTVPFGYNIKSGGDGGGRHGIETRAIISAAMKGRTPWMKGRSHTDESKSKLAAAHIGLRHTEAARQKMSAAHRGVRFSAEHRANLSAARTRAWARKKAAA